MSIDLTSMIPDISPHYVDLAGFPIAQSLIAALIGTGLFALFVWMFMRVKKKNPHSHFVQIVTVLYEQIFSFFAQIGGKEVTPAGITFTTCIFVYVMWNNLVGLLGDMVVLVWPAAHHVFRPVTTDIMFNAILWIGAVLASLGYGFYRNGPSFISKYLPHKGMGIVEKVDKRRMIFPKILDIILGLLIGLIELIGEVGRMLSLSLRLFWNMFVGMLLLTLVVVGTQNLISIPFLLPLPIFAYELCVGVLQALIFAMLTTIYFKLAGDSHH
jgi:F-type H+-transporting ATPase subunit a